MKAPALVWTTGKRKASTARARFRKGAGTVRVNGVPLEFWQPEIARMKIQEPLLIAGEIPKSLDIWVEVRGGGVMGQASAARTALGRGLARWAGEPGLADLFKRYDRSLLVNDPRRKLPKRPGGRGARKRRQKSYR